MFNYHKTLISIFMLLPILHDNLVQYSLSLVDVQLHAK